MSSIRRASSPIARRTAPIRRAYAATVPAPVLSFTPVSELNELRQLTAVIGVQRIRPIVPAGGIGKDRPVFAAKKKVDRQTRGFAFDVPQGDIDPGNRRHSLRAFTPRDRRRQPSRPSMPRAAGRSARTAFPTRLHSSMRPYRRQSRRNGSPIRKSAASAWPSDGELGECGILPARNGIERRAQSEVFL